MYVPRGFGFSEVGDVEVFPAGDELHLFHLTLPNHDVVQHAVSDDGLAWRTLPAALRTGELGDCDDDQIWTMSVTERGGAYYMVYTALARADDGMVQRTALAYSDDLIHWTKSEHNPVGAADSRWYEAEVSASGRVSWRDPKPILVDGTYYAVVCAREKDGPLLRRGCAGLLASKDLETWEVRPPLLAPRRYWDLECPQVFQIGDRFYLTAAIMEDRTQRYWMAPSFEGPYQTPPDGGVLAPAGHYAGRVCHWHGLDLYYCWHQPWPQSKSLGSLPTVDWANVRNPHGKFVVAPLVLEQRSDGSLARRSFPGWTAYRTGELMPPKPMAASLYHARDSLRDDGWHVDGHDGGMDVLATRDEVGDFWFEGVLVLDALSGGLAFRVDDDGGGYFVEVRAGSHEVSLQKWLPTHDPHEHRPWFRFAELQRGRLNAPAELGARLSFRLIIVGPYIECTLGDEVVLATLSGERWSGRLGIWAESGTMSVRDPLWAPMRAPRHV